MVESSFKYRHVIERLRVGEAGAFVDGFASALDSEGDAGWAALGLGWRGPSFPRVRGARRPDLRALGGCGKRRGAVDCE